MLTPLRETKARHRRHVSARRRRQPIAFWLVIALFVGSAVICAALIAPVVWRLVTENVLQVGATHD